MRPRDIMAIFMVQGTLIGVFGTLIGIIAGVTIALNVPTLIAGLENLLGYQFLPPQVYYISELPSDLHQKDVIIIGVVSFLLSILATIYPSWRASKIRPAEALRYD
jgi:lipoprotein-releasing system permease protein